MPLGAVKEERFPHSGWWAKLYPTLCEPMDCSLPGSSVCGMLQARIVEGVAISFFEGSFRLRDRTRASCTAGRFFTNWVTGEACIGNFRDHEVCAAGLIENSQHTAPGQLPILSNPRHRSAGAHRDWMLKLWLQGPDLGREQGLAVQRLAEGTGVWSAPTWDASRTEPRSAVTAPLLMHCWRERQGLTRRPHSPPAPQLLLYKSRRRVQGGGAEISAVSQRKWTCVHLLHQQLPKLSTCGTSAALLWH